MILTNPGNPSGAVYDEEELVMLTKIFRKYSVIVVSDEIYARLRSLMLAFTHMGRIIMLSRYDGNHVTMSRIYPEGTILTSG